MLFATPPTYRKRRGRPKEAAPLAPPPGPPISVQYVGTDDPPGVGQCLWVFDSPVTLTGTPIGLRVLVDGEWLDPTGAVEAGDDEIICDYPTDATLGDLPWSIVAAPSGIAEAARIVVPEDGTILIP